MQFARPELWSLLLVLPLLWVALWRGAAARREALLRLGDAHLLARVLPAPSPARTALRAALQSLAALLFVVALAGPRWGFQWEEVKRRGVDIVVAIDLSRSMLAQDLKPDRLTAARRELRDLLTLLQGDRVGLVVFAGTAFVQVPLTLDDHALELFIDQLDVDTVPVGGSDLAAGLRKAVEAFAASDRAGRAVLFITDGEDHGGELKKAAEEARDAGVHVFVVGLGDPAGAPVPDGSGGFVEEDGKVVLSKLGEAELREVAALTDGAYVRGTAGDLDLRSLYEDGIRTRLAQDELSSARRKRWEERFQWPLLGAILLLLMEALLRPGPRRVLALALLLLPTVPAPANAGWLDAFRWGKDPLTQGHEHFEAGRFQDAVDAWTSAQAEHGDDRRLDYDIGSARYRLGQFAEAEQAFARAALSAEPGLGADALHNAGNAAFQQGKFTDAIRWYEQSLRLRPGDPETQQNRDLAQRKYEEALAAQDEQDQEPQEDEKDDQNSEKQDSDEQDAQSEEKQEPGDGEGENGEQQKGPPEQQQGRGAQGEQGDQGEGGGEEDGQGQGEPQQPQDAAQEGAGGSEAEQPPQPGQAGQAAAADIQRDGTPTDEATPAGAVESTAIAEQGEGGAPSPTRPGALSSEQARALLQALEADRQARQRERTRRAGQSGRPSAGKDW